MVLEQLFKVKWLETKARHAFFMGFVYSLIGIISAKLIFPSNAGIVSVAFTSLLLIPSLNKLLSMEENVEIREKKFHIGQLLRDHKDIFEIYFFLFMGIFVAYALIALIFPQLAIMKLFTPQLKVAGMTGHATALGTQFVSILKNNIIVLVVCLILSLVYGAGSILFITWNATVWGIVFGFMARESAFIQGVNPFVAFGILILPTLPHLITEASAYFSAAIVGGVVSKATIREKWGSKKFHHILTDAYILLALGFGLVILAGILEVYVFPILYFG